MEITTIGLDIAKNVFQVHGVDGDPPCQKIDKDVFQASMPCQLAGQA